MKKKRKKRPLIHAVHNVVWADIIGKPEAEENGKN